MVSSDPGWEFVPAVLATTVLCLACLVVVVFGTEAVFGDARGDVGTWEWIVAAPVLLVAFGGPMVAALVSYGRFAEPRLYTPPYEEPVGVAELDGYVYVSDAATDRIVVVGDDTYSSFGNYNVPVLPRGEQNYELKLECPSGVASDGKGGLVVADTNHHAVRMITRGEGFDTVAGATDSPHGERPLEYPTGVAVGPAGELYVAETGRDRIHRIEDKTTLVAVAGCGERGFGGDGGPATEARFASPRGIAVDDSGALFIADRFNHRVRRVAPDGTIETVAGTGRPGRAGDGGRATGAELTLPADVTVDAEGRIVIADEGNARVCRLEHDGTLMTLVDGELEAPAGVAALPDGDVFVTDARRSRVWRIAPEGTAAVVRPEFYRWERSARRQRWLAASWAVIPAALAAGTLWLANAVDPTEDAKAAAAPTRGEVWQLASGAGAVWAVDGKAGVVSRIDPERLRVIRGERTGAGAITASRRDVWAASGRQLFRVDPRTARARPGVVSLRRGRVGAILLAHRRLWVADFARGLLLVYDPQTRRRVGRPVDVGDGPIAMAADADGLWVLSQVLRQVVHVDAGSARIDAGPVRVGDRPVDVAVAGGAAWVANSDDTTLTRVTRDGDATRHPAGTSGVAASGDALWSVEENTVYELDPRDGTPQGPRRRVSDASLLGEVTVHDGRLFAADAETGLVWRIDP